MIETSVIIPVLNGERHIGEAYASIAEQLAPDDEIIVVDNGSTDATASIVAGFSDARVRMLSEPVLGPGAARNRGLLEAHGTYVAFLDHDDMWPEGRHARMLAAMADGVDGVRGRFAVRFDEGVDPLFEVLNGNLNTESGLCAFLFRRSSLPASGAFDPALIFGEDIDFMLRLSEAGAHLVTIDHDGLIYRRHATNMTHDLARTDRGMVDVLRRRILRRRKGARPA